MLMRWAEAAAAAAVAAVGGQPGSSVGDRLLDTLPVYKQSLLMQAEAVCVCVCCVWRAELCCGVLLGAVRGVHLAALRSAVEGTTRTHAVVRVPQVKDVFDLDQLNSQLPMVPPPRRAPRALF